MKIAALADIHANYRALEAVVDHLERWKPDAVFVAGDIVNRGPRSLCCLQQIEEKRQQAGWQVIRGNHEDYVIERGQPDDPQSGPFYEMIRPIHFTYNQLHRDTTALQALPERISLDCGPVGEVRMLHASVLGNRDGIYPETSDDELATKIAPAPAVFVTGHTHRPLVRSLNGTLVVNVGSVGLPFDGDTRAGYAQIEWRDGYWRAEIVRLEYDLRAAEQDFHTFGFWEQGGPLTELILLELKTGMGQLYQWVAKYNQPILRGQISLEQAVQEFLEHPITEPYWFNEEYEV
ncbi:MAG: metallophosphoesterase family protein [Anaerolineales bacterium]